MKKDDFKTVVIFRKFKNGKKEILALFPYAYFYKIGNKDTCESYMHIGQHSDASYSQCMKITVPAKKEEYQSLFQELESIGYDLEIKQRRNYK